MELITGLAKKQLAPFDGKIYEDLVTRTLYATDASMFKILPLIVIEPASYNDVKKVIRFAREHRLPIAARGGGTGLAGESLTAGIVLDFSSNLNNILEIDLDHNLVKVQAGVVLGELNRQLAQSGKLFGPDPATANRCTLGGMIANNSTGAHSLRYGMTHNWLKSATVMLDDGSIETFKCEPLDSPVIEKILKENSRRGEIYRELISLLQNNQQLIEKSYPKTPRNRHGYLLNNVIKDGTINLAQLFCAAEGTLGILLEAELGICDLSPSSRLIYLTFENRKDAANTTYPLLQFDPSAIEIIDNVCLDMARTEPLYAKIFDSQVNSILLVELDGNNEEMVNQKIDNIREFAKDKNNNVKSIQVCQSQQERDTIWTMRKLIAGMINKVPGRFQPVPIIEDVCINPEKLSEYFEGIDKILTKRNLKYLCFGHAGSGTVHIRPFLDLKSNETYKWLPAMCHEVYDLTLELKGTISGEHGDGFLRAPFIEKQYGPLFDVFLQVKRILDPHNIFNPDKQTGMRDFEVWQKFLRYGGDYQPQEYKTQLNWREHKLLEIVEACNGCGQCRSKLKDSDMCPMFRVFGREIASTRAKANLMRSLLTGELDRATTKEILEVANYCINCKMCEVNCPSSVAAGDLMLEIKAQAIKKLGSSVEIFAITNMEKMLAFGSKLPKISNYFSQKRAVKFLIDRLSKITAKRTPPKLSLFPFHTKKKIIIKSEVESVDKVVYFVDSFAKFVNTDVAYKFIEILKHNNVEIVIPPQKGSGVVQLNYGHVREAKKIASYNIAQLIPYVKQGYKVVCTEPTAALMLKKEYLLLCDDHDFKMIAENTFDASSFLLYLHQNKRLKTDFVPMPFTVGHHTPCHQKIIQESSATLEILKLIPELKVEFINEGCCGIAGTFGMRQKGHDISLKIGRKLFEKLQKGDIKYGVTDCSTCKMQMEYGVPNKKTFHIVEILAQAYGF